MNLSVYVVIVETRDNTEVLGVYLHSDTAYRVAKEHSKVPSGALGKSSDSPKILVRVADFFKE